MDTRKKMPGTHLPCPHRVLLYVVIGLSCLPLPAWCSEATLRVAFVYNFVKFINWPPDTNSRFNLCVLGVKGDAQTALLQLNGKQLNKKTIDVVFLTDQSTVANDVASCQMLYRPASATQMLLPHPLPHGVVLVADDPFFGEQDVSISLVRGAEGRIEFEIDQAAVAQAGVEVSSQLLKLAKNTRGG